MLTPAGALGLEGPFSRVIDGFAPRPQQQAMADEVARAIDDYATLVCEAGTGTGKTLAYLTPALLSGKKVIVSTGTKNLQEQLYHRDLPLVRKALGHSARVALLKGRANYLCLQRLETAQAGGAATPELAVELAGVRSWAGRTGSGDVAELSAISESSPVWRHVTSTVDNCLGTECAFYRDCHVLKARRRAIEADLVVINHHLFFADMALREEGFGELLPGADAIVLDEAHQLPETAARFFGVSVSSGQIAELGRDSIAAYYGEAGDVPELPDLARTLEKRARDLRLAFGSEVRKIPWNEDSARPAVISGVEALKRTLKELQAALEPLAERGKELQSCRHRCAELAGRVQHVCEPSDHDTVRWLELYRRGFTWYASPVEIGEIFGAHVRAKKCAWIFTSATLAVGGKFDHIATRLGLGERRDRLWDSPFDFTAQALCYLPEDLPDPREAGFTAAVVAAALPVLEASRGRAFMLFTSHSALQRAAEILGEQSSFPLMVQGDAPKDALLRRFRETAGAVLLGTSSFWEGVDVRGEALSCVIIDKLPFAAPNDPMLQAQYRALREQGRDPFMDHQLPQAVIALKQGVGRLIRDVNDRGVLMICDRRLYRKAYGRVFLNSLPPMPRSRELAAVQAFFETAPREPVSDARASGR